ncbi:MAG TPA: T9SS type A sorting domain-containing protein [Chitinophagales bacterium]|nr:T9SS type A sorting domain-containing protein [Chitinophagales bacterium]HMV03793.1 T9SS type A sorting domain-containing protein [Chitinophagales bacterium]HMW94912.1 T9SS type A sorting domain-containing protein [Chitinophagales bacterium]HMY42935.1 T9SS type A sorting domain-containing protein [Chitinophagales bacterium]HMZ68908.1 T9SS type A sorting domain-containing protein [Chitinophagales bacterium]
MKRLNLKNIILVLVGCLWLNFLQAQTSINTSGGNAIGTGGAVASSIGQLFYTSDKSSSALIEAGVQHAYEIYLLKVKGNVLTVSLSVYPNPTTNQLALKVEGLKNEQLSFQLLDLQGRLLSADKVVNAETVIQMSHLASAAYLLNVVDEKTGGMKSFKIIKN